MKKIYFVIFVNLLIVSLYADVKNDSTENSDAFSMFAYPYAFYMPETGLAFGGSAIINFLTSMKNFNRPSQVILNGYYTTIGNFSISLDQKIYFPTFSLHPYIFYDKILTRFYGIGNTTEDISEPDFKANKYGLTIAFDKNIGKVLFGLIFDLSKWNITDYMKNPYLSYGDITGSSGGISSGFGFSLGFDTRDYIFLPEKGHYHNFRLTFFRKAFGSDFNFTRYIVDLRKYWFFMEKISLGWQYFGQFITGEAPFYYLPALGGSKIMRGYFEGRFRDKLYMASQIESTIYFSVFGLDRFGASGFAGLGEVSDQFKNFSLPGIKWSLGIGLRYLLDKKNRTIIRADVGFGENTAGVYFAAGTAF